MQGLTQLAACSPSCSCLSARAVQEAAFALGERGGVLAQLDQSPIIPHMADMEGKRFPYEVRGGAGQGGDWGKGRHGCNRRLCCPAWSRHVLSTCAAWCRISILMLWVQC